MPQFVGGIARIAIGTTSITQTAGKANITLGLTTIADLAEIDGTVSVQARLIYENTFVKAQLYNLEMMKEIGPDYMPRCYYGNQWPLIPNDWHRPHFQIMNGFLNEYVA